MAVEIIDTLKAKNNGDFPVAEANDLKGGWQTVQTMEELRALTTSKKSEGMVVTVTSIDMRYILKNGEWVLYKGGSSVHIGPNQPSPEENDLWINPEGDNIELPLEPENPVVVELRNTIKAQNDKINRLELLVRRIIDGGTYTNKPSDNIDTIATRAVIQVRRGNHADIPSNLDVGEFGLSLDTRDLYIGTGNGNIQINPTKNIFEDKIYLYSENKTKYKLSISNDGYMNITKEITKEIVPPIVDKGYKVSINSSQNIATNGDNIQIQIVVENTSKIKSVSLNMYDNLLDNNMNVHITDIHNLIYPKSTDNNSLFNNKNSNSVLLMAGERMTITYVLNINNNVRKDIVHNILGTEHKINIIRG